MNARFSNMHKAFQFADLDGSGSLTIDEIERALELWGVPAPPEGFGPLFSKCDPDGSGEVTYTEFVNALARDTVQRKIEDEFPAAPKAGLQPST